MPQQPNNRKHTDFAIVGSRIETGRPVDDSQRPGPEFWCGWDSPVQYGERAKAEGDQLGVSRLQALETQSLTSATSSALRSPPVAQRAVSSTSSPPLSRRDRGNDSSKLLRLITGILLEILDARAQ